MTKFFKLSITGSFIWLTGNERFFLDFLFCQKYFLSILGQSESLCNDEHSVFKNWVTVFKIKTLLLYYCFVKN